MTNGIDVLDNPFYGEFTADALAQARRLDHRDEFPEDDPQKDRRGNPAPKMIGSRRTVGDDDNGVRGRDFTTWKRHRRTKWRRTRLFAINE